MEHVGTSQRSSPERDAVEQSLAAAVVRSAELVAELEERSDRLDLLNRELAAANARAAELVAELQAGREELEWANASLRQADEAHRRLLRVAAHDLRGGLGGVAATLETGDPALARSELERLVRLLDDLLGGSRQELGHMVLRAQAVPLRRLLDDAVRAHAPTATRKRQSLQVSSVPDDIRVDADPIRLRQVVDNLLSNAIKFGPVGGVVDVEALEIRGAVIIEIRDQGPGFAPGDLDRAFGEFQTLSARPTAGEASHGIGLSIVRRIVAAHGGTVTAANRTDRSGATFRVALPSPVTPGGARRVLVVDDDGLNRRYLRALIERHGHHVEESPSGEDGLAQVFNAAPGYHDLVLLDLEMPGIDGIETARRLRAREAGTARLPIVAVTGHADGEILASALEAGIDDIVLKPLRSPGVRCILRRWCRSD